MDNTLPYETKVVALIDILGFSALISELSTQPELHNLLQYVLNYIKSHKKTSSMEGTTHSDLEVSIFSDSIVISSEEHDADNLIWACGWLQAKLFNSGILTRGGMSIGKLVHKNDILYGEAMIKAYQIETKAAVYPRIVVVPKLLNHINAEIKSNYLSEDSDGLWFVDPFKFDEMAPGAEALASDGNDPREIYFEEVGKQIRIGINKAKQLNHISKWTWLSKRHQEAYEAYLRTRST